MKRCLPVQITLCCVVLSFISPSHAQWRTGDSTLPSCSDMEGTVYQSQRAGVGLTIELRSFSQAGLPQRTSLDNGSFQFRCVPQGGYDLRIVNVRGMVIHSEHVEVGSGSNSVLINLRETPSTAEQPVSPWVSVRQLKRKIDRKAEGELRKAYAAAEKSKFDEAVLHARKALDRDPAYPEVFLLLGVASSNLERNEEAAEHFSRAAELDPDSVLAHSNLAIVMLKLQRYAAAEEPARRALKIASPLPKMHYALGVSLAQQQRNLDEAVLHLDRAANSFPRARLAAVDILARAGRRTDAAARLEEYLRTSGETDNRKELENLLANLK